MPIGIRVVESGINGAGHSIGVNVPAGTVNGDFMIACIVAYGTGGVAGTAVDPSGWTKIGEANTGSAGNNTDAAWYYRVASSEPASYTFSNTGGDNYIDADITTFTGVDVGNPFNISALSANGKSTAPTTTDLGSTTRDGCWHFLKYSCFDSVSASPPSGYTEDKLYDTSNEVSHKLISPAGATGAQAITTAAANGWVAWAVALNAAGAVYYRAPFPRISGLRVG